MTTYEMTPSASPFHVVHRCYNGKHRGYEVWCNNRPFITLRDGLALKRQEAYALARAFNA